MTWQNLPCAPTLPALFAACPHGWAEIEFTYQRGDPTARGKAGAVGKVDDRVRALRGLAGTGKTTTGAEADPDPRQELFSEKRHTDS